MEFILDNRPNRRKSQHLWLVFILLITLMGGRVTAVSPVQAQSEPLITLNRAAPTFPDAIQFNLIASHESGIKQITLIYGTQGLSCQSNGSRQLADFVGEQAIVASWDWELWRGRGLPPGTIDWWQWELELADGSRHTTPTQEMQFLDPHEQWQTIRRDGLTVRWYEGNEQFGEEMFAEAKQSLARIAADFGVTQPPQVDLWFYPSALAVKEVIQNVPEWTGGVAFPEYGITVLGVAPGQSEWAAQIIPHELTHLVVGVRVFNCRGVRLPTWLNEGLARYAEQEVATVAQQEVESALAAGRMPTLRSLANGFSAYGNAASLSYTQSYLVVKYLVEEFGTADLDSFLQLMQEGTRIDPALQAVYGFDTDGLDVAWRTSLGYIPTPTHEADGLAGQITATPIPTLALGGIPVAQPVATASATPLPFTETPMATSVPPSPTATPTQPLPTATTISTVSVPTSTTVAPSPSPTPAISSAPPSTPIPTGLWIGGALLLLGVAGVWYWRRSRL